jgi:hypothetical protein
MSDMKPYVSSGAKKTTKPKKTSNKKQVKVTKKSK